MGESYSSLKRSGVDIGLKLFEAELKNTDDNFAFSPLSIQIVISMLTLGSRNSTRDQLIDFMGADRNSDFDALKKKLAWAIQTFEKMDDSALVNIASCVFLQEDCEMDPVFKSEMKNFFQAKAKSIDFENAAKAAKVINGYVSKKTKDKITNIVEESQMEDSLLVLINCLYFKADWRVPFNPNYTRKDKFHISDSDSVEADFMSRTGSVLVGDFEGRTVAALPYKGDRFTMYLVHPRKDGDKLEMNAEDVVDTLDVKKFIPTDVDLLLPRFKMEYDMDLKNRLQNFGIHDVFDASVADLTALSGDCANDAKLAVSSAQHKIFIEVTEKGTEAAAVTAIVIETRKAYLTPENLLAIHFDEPFVFFLKDEKTGLILMQGRVTDPTVGWQ